MKGHMKYSLKSEGEVLSTNADFVTNQGVGFKSKRIRTFAENVCRKNNFRIWD